MMRHKRAATWLGSSIVPSAHRVAFAVKRSPVFARIAKTIAASALMPQAKREAIAACETMFRNAFLHSGTGNIFWPAVLELEGRGVTGIRVEHDHIAGVSPEGTPIKVAFATFATEPESHEHQQHDHPR